MPRRIPSFGGDRTARDIFLQHKAGGDQFRGDLGDSGNVGVPIGIAFRD